MFILGINSPKDVSEAAKGFGALDASSVWALFALVFLLYILRESSRKNSQSEKDASVRIEEAKAVTLMSSAIENMTDKICDQMKELRIKIKCMGDKDA